MLTIKKFFATKGILKYLKMWGSVWKIVRLSERFRIESRVFLSFTSDSVLLLMAQTHGVPSFKRPHGSHSPQEFSRPEYWTG